MSANPNQVVIIYDQECPVCTRYCRMLRLRESFSEVLLVNARENSIHRKWATDRGFNLNEGMVLKIGDLGYAGADAVHHLALMSTRSGLFNRLNAWIFRSQYLSACFYPVLRFGRNILLRLLRVEKIT